LRQFFGASLSAYWEKISGGGSERARAIFCAMNDEDDEDDEDDACERLKSRSKRLKNCCKKVERVI